MSVGIIGDGQLARMMAQAANRLGLDYLVLSESNKSSACTGFSDKHRYNGDRNDYDDVYNLCSRVKTLTIEIEHFNLQAVEKAQTVYNFEVFPQIDVIKIIRDKLKQKKWFIENNICTAKILEDFDSLIPHPADTTGIVLKKRISSYDGRGFILFDNSDDWKCWLEENESALNEYYVEEKVEFTAELAVIVYANMEKNIIGCYPCVESIQVRGMCRAVLAPAPIETRVLHEATEVAMNVAKNFNLKGILCVEMFYTPKGILVNEIAPRPHNTGHYTIEACMTSQFEQIMRIASGLPPGSTKMRTEKALMVNLIGKDEHYTLSEFEHSARELVFRIPNASIHLYKKSPKFNRKIGHFTVLGDKLGSIINNVRVALRETVLKFESFDDHLNNIYINKKLHSTCEVAIVMGSISDMPVMQDAIDFLKNMEIVTFVSIVSAHRTPDRMYNFAKNAERNGFKVIIAGAGGAAHLPGMIASLTQIPVIGVPVAQKYLSGADSLYSIVQMPAGIPVATVAINNSTNAAILAAKILSLQNPDIAAKLVIHTKLLKDKVLNDVLSIEKLKFVSQQFDFCS